MDRDAKGTANQAKTVPNLQGFRPRSHMTAAAIGAARKKHPGKAIMAGEIKFILICEVMI